MRRCVWSRNIKNRCSIYIYIYIDIYIYDISSLRVNTHVSAMKWLFCRPGIPKTMSTAPELQLWIASISKWPEFESKSNSDSIVNGTHNPGTSVPDIRLCEMIAWNWKWKHLVYILTGGKYVFIKIKEIHKLSCKQQVYKIYSRMLVQKYVSAWIFSSHGRRLEGIWKPLTSLFHNLKE